MREEESLAESRPAVMDDVAIRGRGRSNEHLPRRRILESGGERSTFSALTAWQGFHRLSCVFSEGVPPLHLPSGLIVEETWLNKLNSVNAAAADSFNLRCHVKMVPILRPVLGIGALSGVEYSDGTCKIHVEATTPMPVAYALYVYCTKPGTVFLL